MSDITDSACCCCELEIRISASSDTVWRAIFHDIHDWWLPDFHVMGEDSKLSFDAQPGGNGLIEQGSDGGWLQWYTVQMHLPAQKKVYLVGHVAPEWGGPMTSMLSLSVVETNTGCVLKVTDARYGHVSEPHVRSYKDGWQQLFGDGLKRHVESRADQS